MRYLPDSVQVYSKKNLLDVEAGSGRGKKLSLYSTNQVVSFLKTFNGTVKFVKSQMVKIAKTSRFIYSLIGQDESISNTKSLVRSFTNDEERHRNQKTHTFFALVFA